MSDAEARFLITKVFRKVPLTAGWFMSSLTYVVFVDNAAASTPGRDQTLLPQGPDGPSVCSGVATGAPKDTRMED